MNLTGVLFVIVSVLSSTAYAIWFQRSTRGLSLGNGFTLRFDNAKSENASFFERLALRYDNSGFGVTIGKALTTDGLQIGFYESRKGNRGSRGYDGDGDEEIEEGGGGKKVGDVVIPTLMGFKMASITTMALFGISLFVVKVLGLAKLALIVSGTLLLARFLQKPEATVEVLPPEFDHQASENQQFYADYQGLQDPATYSNPSAAAAANYYAYANYVPPTGQENAAAESVSNFAIVESPNNNIVSNASSTNSQQQQGEAISKRRDYVRRKLRVYPSSLQKKLKKYTLHV